MIICKYEHEFQLLLVQLRQLCSFHLIPFYHFIADNRWGGSTVKREPVQDCRLPMRLVLKIEFSPEIHLLMIYKLFGLSSLYYLVGLVHHFHWSPAVL